MSDEQANTFQAFELKTGEFSVGLSSELPTHIILLCRDQVALTFPVEAAKILHNQLCIAIGMLEEGEPTEEIPTNKKSWN